MNRDPVSKPVGIRTRHGWQNVNAGELSDPLQKLLYLPPFEFDLMVVSDMLIIAPAATTEIFADRRDSIGRRYNDRNEPGTIETFPLLDYRCLDLLAVDGERDEHSLALKTPDTFSAECNIVN